MDWIFWYTAAFNMKCNEIVVFIERGPVCCRVHWTIDTISHVVFSGVNQFHRCLDLLRNDCGLNKMMTIRSYPKTSAHARQLDVYLFFWHSKTCGECVTNKLRCLNRCVDLRAV